MDSKMWLRNLKIPLGWKIPATREEPIEEKIFFSKDAELKSSITVNTAPSSLQT